MNTEQMAELLDGLSINELTLLAKLAQERKEVKERELVEAARIKFIKAYQDYRKLAPNATGYISWEYDNNSGKRKKQDFDLYEMLDCAIEEGFV